MLKKTAVVKADVEVTEPLPPISVVVKNKAKKHFRETKGVPQVYIGSKPGYITMFFFGPHGEGEKVIPLPKRRQGGAAAKAFLTAIQWGIKLFDDDFHIRHCVAKFSPYYTLTIIEEERRARSNLQDVGQIRALLRMADITVYGESTRTAKDRHMFIQESASLGNNLYRLS